MKPPRASTGGLSVALFGAGGYGAIHLDILLELQRKGLVDLRAVADPAISSLGGVCARLEDAQIPYYDSPQDLLDRSSGVQAVSIAAPIPWHEELCRLALKRDLFIYLEKPPVPLVQQWDSLLALESMNESRKIAVAFQNIASLPIRTLKQWCVGGRLGKIQSIRIAAGWPRGRGYFGRNNWAGKMALGDVPVVDGPATNGLAHVVHNAMFLASPEPDGFAVPLRVKAELYRAQPIDSYDTCSIQAELEGGIDLTATLTHACFELFPYQIVVMGSKGSAWIGEDGILLENDQSWASVREPAAVSRASCFENFVLYALGQRPRPDSFLADTRGYMLLTNAMLLSSGPIHPIASPHASLAGQGPETVDAIHGIFEMLRATLKTGRTLSEQAVPWARPGHWIGTGDLQHVSLQSLRALADSVR